MMRRKDREITDFNQITQIILQCTCCRLAFCDGNIPYIVPLTFGYSEINGNRVFYFHSANEGRKIDLIGKTHFACFELDTGYSLIEAEKACDYSAKYKSVIGTGKVSFIETSEEKRFALTALMERNTGKKEWYFTEIMLNAVCVFKLEVEEISAKERK